MEGGREREGGRKGGKEGERRRDWSVCETEKKGERGAIPVNSYLMPNSKEATMSLV